MRWSTLSSGKPGGLPVPGPYICALPPSKRIRFVLRPLKPLRLTSSPSATMSSSERTGSTPAHSLMRSEIGRASCRERVQNRGVDEAHKKKKRKVQRSRGSSEQDHVEGSEH